MSGEFLGKGILIGGGSEELYRLPSTKKRGLDLPLAGA